MQEILSKYAGIFGQTYRHKVLVLLMLWMTFVLQSMNGLQHRKVWTTTCVKNQPAYAVPSYCCVLANEFFMKIAILTMGTRGDVQPYAILGQALRERGHEVTLSTAKNFESLVNSYGIGFRPVEADFQALLASEEGKNLSRLFCRSIPRQNDLCIGAAHR